MEEAPKKPRSRMTWYISGALAVIVIAAIVVTLLVTHRGGPSANAPSAQQLIKNAQTAIQNVTSYHFNLTVDNPGTGGILVIKSADGDILVPHRLKANASVLILGNVVQVQIITIDSNQYVTDPITGNWTRTTGLLDPRSLSNSNTGVAAILGHIQNPSSPTDANVGGTSCWSINGTLDAKYLAGITGGGAPAGSTVAVTACIGKSDNLPYQIKMTGIAAAGDNKNTVRTFTLSKFGESLTINAPIK
ncbi:MAG TPA: LppX_LprAFG lipoprotein [Ktedonobacteraceae bacterium]|nr:LppX_LprAFG lipoprotein [Ktedonobacteraceae bacterium]